MPPKYFQLLTINTKIKVYKDKVLRLNIFFQFLFSKMGSFVIVVTLKKLQGVSVKRFYLIRLIESNFYYFHQGHLAKGPFVDFHQGIPFCHLSIKNC